jgi:hypothetical protein
VQVPRGVYDLRRHIQGEQEAASQLRVRGRGGVGRALRRKLGGGAREPRNGRAVRHHRAVELLYALQPLWRIPACQRALGGRQGRGRPHPCHPSYSSWFRSSCGVLVMVVKRNASCARKVIAVFTAAVAVAVFAIPTGIFGNGFQARRRPPNPMRRPCRQSAPGRAPASERIGAPTRGGPIGTLRSTPRSSRRSSRRRRAPSRAPVTTRRAASTSSCTARAPPAGRTSGISAPPPPATRAPSRRYASRIDPLTREAPKRLLLSARADARLGA